LKKCKYFLFVPIVGDGCFDENKVLLGHIVQASISPSRPLQGCFYSIFSGTAVGKMNPFWVRNIFACTVER